MRGRLRTETVCSVKASWQLTCSDLPAALAESAVKEGGSTMGRVSQPPPGVRAVDAIPLLDLCVLGVEGLFKLCLDLADQELDPGGLLDKLLVLVLAVLALRGRKAVPAVEDVLKSSRVLEFLNFGLQLRLRLVLPGEEQVVLVGVPAGEILEAGNTGLLAPCPREGRVAWSPRACLRERLRLAQWQDNRWSRFRIWFLLLWDLKALDHI
eukprot:3255500-Rhodomonas_salina.2